MLQSTFILAACFGTVFASLQEYAAPPSSTDVVAVPGQHASSTGSTELSPVQSTPGESSPTAAAEESCDTSDVTSTLIVTSVSTFSVTITVKTSSVSATDAEETTTVTQGSTDTEAVTATATGTNPASLPLYPTTLTNTTSVTSVDAIAGQTSQPFVPSVYSGAPGYGPTASAETVVSPVPTDNTTSPAPFTGSAAKAVSGAGMMALIAAPVIVALF